MWCDSEHLSSACPDKSDHVQRQKREAASWKGDVEDRRLHLKQHGEAPARRYAMVLLSGGLDSTALLHWACEAYYEVAAISIGYGQANRDAELTAALRLCERRFVHCDRLEVADAVRGLGLLAPPPPGRGKHGVSRANLVGRNSILVSVAVAQACRRWPGETIDVLCGANLDDAAGFDDCRAEFFDAATEMASVAVARVANVRVKAPWVTMTKASIVGWAATRPEALDDIRQSVSCYAGTRCGACDACTLRASAFTSAGVHDGDCVPLRMTGGDPQRERQP